MKRLQPELNSAIIYATERLSDQLPAELCYHSLGHTCDDVVPAVEQLAHSTGIRGLNVLLVTTAAYFHDLGFVIRRNEHEEASIELAELALLTCGYQPRHIRRIAAMIRATKLPQRPHSLLAQILADADLDVLGRSDFLERNQALRQELANYNQPVSDSQWYSQQYAFLQQHQYWTPAARLLRDAGKQQNVQLLSELLAKATQ